MHNHKQNIDMHMDIKNHSGEVSDVNEKQVNGNCKKKKKAVPVIFFKIHLFKRKRVQVHAHEQEVGEKREEERISRRRPTERRAPRKLTCIP